MFNETALGEETEVHKFCDNALGLKNMCVKGAKNT